MIAVAAPSSLMVRLVAPLVWRSDVKIAAKLEGFAATEAGSALDMLKAAELTDDPALRRLFFRHALDEARHAQLFRAAARRIDPRGRDAGGASEYRLIHATRQNLFERYGLVRFVAFVHLAELRGESQFRALRDHFRAGSDGNDLGELFARIAREERFHVAYSGKLLADWRREGRAREVWQAVARVRFTRAFDAWRRIGRLFGDHATRLLLGLLYLVLLPLFALIQRRRDPVRNGWKRGRRGHEMNTLTDARRQF